jgi:hypothetical protein
MSRKSKHTYLLEKSVQAVVSAIEIYNKPDFKYREESFSILMVNAWELLLKAKILKDNNNSLTTLYIIDKERSLKRDGAPKKNPCYKLNRANNFLTIDIYSALKKLTLDSILRENIDLLIEIRDNAIHFFNDSKLFEKKLLEIGTATLKSYVDVINEWFCYDLTKFNFFLMPISFFHPGDITSLSLNKEDKHHKNLLKYIAKKEKEFPISDVGKHNISLILETKFVRGTSTDAIPMKFDPTNPKAITVKVDSEDQFANKYPWTYTDDLLPRLKERYKNFKADTKYNKIKRVLDKNSLYCGERYLDIKKKKGIPKKYYSPEILKEFDKYYIKKNTDQ